MTDLVMIVPSRGRPEAAAELAQAFKDTCTRDTALVVVVDDNDLTLDEYVGDYLKVVLPSRTMVAALNDGGGMATGFHHDPFAMGFMGDDHRPRTKGWDSALLAELWELKTGIVYGNDLLQGENLPTQVAMTVDIPRTLGYMAPPRLTHMYVDNFWLDLGQACGCIRYLPDVVIEHMHPLAGKVEWDAGHIRVNAESMYSTDRVAYMRYKATQFRADVAKIQALRVGA